MKTKINIAAILKDKPQGTKLYNWLHNIDVELDTISTTDTETVVWCTNDTNNNTTCNRGYSEFGTERGYPDGLQILFPSKEMRDWSKFAWKKGDVLINSCGFQCIFKEWAFDDYTKFNGCYSNSRDGYEDVSNAETAKFVKLDNNIAYGYVREIERKLGGILNLATLEIEKQPEFKDGDIVALMVRKCTHIAIFQSRQEMYIGFHAVLCNNEQLLLEEPFREDDGDIELRPATDSEKQKLFEALVREGKRWNPDKLQIEDLPKKCEFYPFDKVLVRDTKDELWRPAFFASFDEHCITEYAYGLIGDPEGVFCKYCIPYNEETAHLLGTTDDWKGGDG